MDAARTIIVAKVAELGLSLSELSLSVGKNHAYFQQFIKRGVPARLPEEVRGRVAEILKIDERTLKLGAAKPSPAAPGANAHVGGAVRITTWIPVYGQAVGGKDGEFVLNGNQASEVLAPSTLAGVPGAYAVYVLGELDGAALFRGRNRVCEPALAGEQGNLRGRSDRQRRRGRRAARLRQAIRVARRPAAKAGTIQSEENSGVSRLESGVDPPDHHVRGTAIGGDGRPRGVTHCQLVLEEADKRGLQVSRSGSGTPHRGVPQLPRGTQQMRSSG